MQTATQDPYSSRGRPGQPGMKPRELAGAARDRLRELLPEELLPDALRGPHPEEITGPGGLLSELAGRMINAALQGEITDHLGYAPGQAPPGGTDNARSGSTAKTVHTDIGSIDVSTPRDRKRTFDPKLVAKRQTRLAGLDDRILGMYAGAMSGREIRALLRDLYGRGAAPDTITRVTDSVLGDIAAWRARPLDPVYPIVYFQALTVKATGDSLAATTACCLALGVTSEGERKILGIWCQDKDGARFWPVVLGELGQRGVRDILIARVDGLTGFSQAISASETWVHTTKDQPTSRASRQEDPTASLAGAGRAGGGSRDRRPRNSWSAARIPFPVALVAVVAVAGAAGWAISHAFSSAPASAASASSPGLARRAAATHRASGSTPRGLSYVAVAKYGELTIYRRPSAPTRMLTLAKPTSTQPLTLLVKQRRAGWVQAYLPIRPNGSLGWVRTAAIRLLEDRWAVVIQLHSRRLVVRRADRVIRTLPIAVGKPSTPTPTGHYFITELLKQPDPGGAYGPYAFGTSDYSDVLLHFGTGNGQIGIHGTDQPWVIGTSASHGCIRLYNRDIVWLSQRLPLGTPVRIAG